ncbi:MAG TPA: hypothetical protein VMU45_09960 [Candidatus Eisenbacteria bacterium]|nr:hypothetical protein [Candidatus Eisenbacteria bacterium]
MAFAMRWSIGRRWLPGASSWPVISSSHSVAYSIVVEKARTVTHISFQDYMKTGVPITLATLAVGLLWLEFVRY